ncbi:hypothetical protein LY90DRAFT_669869, partial [Neocallimastix californiae]
METTINNNNNNKRDEIEINKKNKNEIISVENNEEAIKEQSIINKNKLIDSEIYNLTNYSNFNLTNEDKSFDSREDIYYPLDDDHDDDSFPNSPWIFSSDEESKSNIFDQDQYEDERINIDDEQWTELYNNDEIFNFIYSDKNLFPGYFQKYLKNVKVESFEKSWKKILTKYMDFKNNYHINNSGKPFEKFNEDLLQKDFFIQKRDIDEKKDNLKEKENLFNEITNDINKIQKTGNALLTDYVNDTIKLCEYANQKFPETDISYFFNDFDYNIDNAYKLKVPMSNKLQKDVTYINMYIDHKDKYKMLLLSKKLMKILNEKRIEIAYQLGISTLEYENIQDIDILTKELEKERLKEMVIISKRLSKKEHYKCLGLIKNEKQKKRKELEKKYLRKIKTMKEEKKMNKKRREAYLRALKVKDENHIEYIKNENQKTKEINKKIDALKMLENEIYIKKQNFKKTKYPLQEISKYEFQLNNPIKYIKSRKFIIDNDIKKKKVHQNINNDEIIKKIIDEEQTEAKIKSTLKKSDIINNRKKSIYYSKLVETHKDDLIESTDELNYNNTIQLEKNINFNNNKNSNLINVDSNDSNISNSLKNVKEFYEREFPSIDEINKMSSKKRESPTNTRKKIRFHKDIDDKNNSNKNELNSIDNTEKVHIPLPRPKNNIKPSENAVQLDKNILPFSTKPINLTFSDFESGTVYVKSVLLTNTSGRVNTFKLLPLPIEIASYFDVQYKLQGMMSAGMTCKIEVIFNCPNGFNEDIVESSINFEAAYGGIFKIPINCFAKRCIPKIISINGKPLRKYLNSSQSFYTNSSKQKSSHLSNQQINENEIEIYFGKCISGGYVNKLIEIGNSGALDTNYIIRPISDEEMLENEDSKSNENEENDENNDLKKEDNTDSYRLSKSDINITNDYIIKEKSMINDYSSNIEYVNSSSSKSIKDDLYKKESLFSVTKNSEGSLVRTTNVFINIKYSPSYELKTHNESLNNNIQLKSKEHIKRFIIEFENENTKPIYIKCIGYALEVPIFIDYNVLDFKLCVSGCVYRNRVQILNESNIALKFTVALANEKFYKAHENLLNDIDINFFKNMGLNISKPSEFFINSLPPFIESFKFNPNLAFAQPNEPFSIWFKIKIQKKISLNQSLVDEFFEIPVIITYIYGNVKCPLPILLKGRITSVGIQVEPNGIIDFKNVSVFEKGYVPINITNNSLLPQKLLFQSKSPVLSVLNPKNETIITLKSREVIMVYLIFQPLEVVKYSGNNMKIIGYTDHGLKFEILCIGNGVQSALKLSNNYIKFSTTSIGRINTTNIEILHNKMNIWKGIKSSTHQNIYDYKFGMPVLFKAQKYDSEKKQVKDISIKDKNRIYDCLRVTPHKGTLRPEEYALLEVSFCPSENDYYIEGGKTEDELKKIGRKLFDENDDLGTSDNAEKKTNNSIKNNFSLLQETNSIQKATRNRKYNDTNKNQTSVSMINISDRSSIITNLDFIMPCIISQHKNFNIDLLKLKIPFGIKTDTIEKDYQQNDSFVIHLLLSTSIIKPDLVSENNKSSIYFGNILLNSESIYEIPLKNETDKPKKVNMTCLNPVGPFDLVCCLREIPPKSIFNAKILFRPTKPILYKETCEFYTETSSVKIELNGVGIEPKVLIEPKNIEFND